MIKYILKLLVIFLLPLLIQVGFGYTSSFVPSIFITAILLWFSEIIPLPITGLLIPTMGVLYGELNPDKAFSAFGNQIIFLFIGCFFLAKAFHHHGLDKRLAFFILSTSMAQKSLFHLKILFSLVCWCFSMWMSNTATCALMTPICLGLSDALDETFTNKKSKEKFTKNLLFLCAYASSIGGLATPIGSPPNLMAMEFLKQKGIEISFLKWMSFGVPISLLMLFLLNILLEKIFKIEEIKLNQLNDFFKIQVKKLGPFKTGEMQVLFCFFLALVLWSLPGLFQLIPGLEHLTVTMNKYLPMGIVALLCSLLLFFLPLGSERNLSWEMAKDIDWGTILLFGGGLSLGVLLNNSNLSNLLGHYVFEAVNGNFILLGLFAILAAIIMSEFSSNTASASIIIPIVIGGVSNLEMNSILFLVLACSYGTSFGFMLPVSTPPNAIIYSTQRISMKEMIRTGIGFDFLGLIVIFSFMILLIPQIIGH